MLEVIVASQAVVILALLYALLVGQPAAAVLLVARATQTAAVVYPTPLPTRCSVYLSQRCP